MHKVLLAIGAAALCSSVLLAAEQRTPVTITGCVHRGTSGDSYVLTNVHEVSGGESRLATNLYWLSTTKGLKDFVDQQVEVNGTYSLSRDAGKTGKVKVKADPSTGEERVVLENGLKKAEAKVDAPPRPVGTSGTIAEFTRPYRRLEVQSVKMIAARCDAP